MPLGIFSPTVNPSGQVVSGATQVTQFISTVTNLSPPTSAAAFILQTDSGNSINARWRLGLPASFAIGHQLEPGRDSGIVPVAAGLTLSLIPETASTTISIQLTWFIAT
jgi:hypothetical protein